MHTAFNIVELDVPYEKRQLVKDNGCYWNKDLWRCCISAFNKDKVEKIINSELNDE
jgi:hypothetical protein